MKSIEDNAVAILAPVMKEYKLACITIAYEAGGDSFDGYNMQYTAREGVVLDYVAIGEAIDRNSSNNGLFLVDFIDKTAPILFETDAGSDGEITLSYDALNDIFTFAHSNTKLECNSIFKSGRLDWDAMSDDNQKFVQNMFGVLNTSGIGSQMFNISVSGIDSADGLIFSTNPPLSDPTDATQDFIRAVLRDVISEDYTLDQTDGINIALSIHTEDDVPVIQYYIDIERDTTKLDTKMCFQKRYFSSDIPSIGNDQPSKPKSGIKP
jgi:hypothetical protein